MHGAQAEGTQADGLKARRGALRPAEASHVKDAEGACERSDVLAAAVGRAARL